MLISHNSFASLLARTSATAAPPDARSTLINSFAVADRVYISTSGNDMTGDGSKGNPYQSLDHVKTLTLANKALIDKDGASYQITPTTTTVKVLCGQEFNDCTIIGVPGLTRISSATAQASGDEKALIGTETDGSSFYDIIFEQDNGGTSTAPNCAIISRANTVAAKGKAINCVFEQINANGNFSFHNGPNGSTFELHHCLIVADTMLAGDNSTCVVNNTACTTTADYGNATGSDNIDGIAVNTDFEIDGGGISFDGVDDYLQCAAHSDFAFGTGTFSLYAVLRFDGLSERYLFGPGGRGSGSNYGSGWGVRFDPSRGLCLFEPGQANASTESYSAWSPVIGTRYRILITRNGSYEIDMWIGEGTGDLVQGTVLNDARSETIGCALNLRIGHSAHSNTSYDFDGSFEEVHIIKGTVLTDSYFPTSGFSPKHANSVLHIYDGLTDHSDSAHSVTTSGNVAVYGDAHQGVYSGTYGWT